jgi:hypothetical protein
VANPCLPELRFVPLLESCEGMQDHTSFVLFWPQVVEPLKKIGKFPAMSVCWHFRCCKRGMSGNQPCASTLKALFEDLIARCRRAMTFQVPIGYQNETGFHLGVQAVDTFQAVCRSPIGYGFVSQPVSYRAKHAVHGRRVGRSCPSRAGSRKELSTVSHSARISF